MKQTSTQTQAAILEEATWVSLTGIIIGEQCPENEQILSIFSLENEVKGEMRIGIESCELMD